MIKVLIFLLPLSLYAQNFNNRLSVQGYLKSGGVAINDATGFPMRFVIKRNSTVVWCQQAGANGRSQQPRRQAIDAPPQKFVAAPVHADLVTPERLGFP